MCSNNHIASNCDNDATYPKPVNQNLVDYFLHYNDIALVGCIRFGTGLKRIIADNQPSLG